MILLRIALVLAGLWQLLYVYTALVHHEAADFAPHRFVHVLAFAIAAAACFTLAGRI